MSLGPQGYPRKPLKIAGFLPGLQFSRLKSSSQDVLRRCFQSLVLGLEAQSLGFGADLEGSSFTVHQAYETEAT